ncbi:MAG: 2-hydroxyacyl-CoA dehydratase family protein [bacterium]
MKKLSKIFDNCKSIVYDTNFTVAKKWKKQDKKRVLIGMIPNFFPREIIHAANGLAVGIVGDEFKLPPDKKIDLSLSQPCSMFSGILDLVKKGKLNGFDGFLLPSRCDTIQALNDLNKLSDKCKFVKYINFPQYFHTVIGDILNQYFVQGVLDEIYKINGVKVKTKSIHDSISLYKNNLKLTEKLYSLSLKYPKKITQKDLYITVFCGLMIPIEEHNAILSDVIDILTKGSNDMDDFVYKVQSGTYC